MEFSKYDYMKISIIQKSQLEIWWFNCLKNSITVATYVSSLRKSNSYKINVSYLYVEYSKHNTRYENCLYSR